MHAGKQETASEIEQLLLVGARQEQEAAYFSLFLLGSLRPRGQNTLARPLLVAKRWARRDRLPGIGHPVTFSPPAASRGFREAFTPL